MEADPFDTTMV